MRLGMRALALSTALISGVVSISPTNPPITVIQNDVGASKNYSGPTVVDVVINQDDDAQAIIDSRAGIGGTVGIAEGAIVRQTLTAKGFTQEHPLKIVGMGSTRPSITGAEPLTNFTQCSSDDQSITGDDFENFYKATISLPDGIEAHELNIHEDGNQLTIANDRGSPESAPNQFITPIETWHTAQSVAGASGEPLTGYSDTRFAEYSQSNLLNALIYGTFESNRTGLFKITSVNGNEVTVENTQNARVENNGNEAKYALINIIAAAKPGQWGYVLNGSNVTVYLRPSNDIEPGFIEYTSRPLVIDSDDMSNVTFEGLRLVQGRQIIARSSGYAINKQDRRKNIHFNECIMGNISCRISEGIVALDSVDHTSFKNITLQNVLGGRAFSLSTMSHWHCSNIHINHIERQPISMFGGQGGSANPPTDNTVQPSRGWSEYLLIEKFLCENSAYETHANAANFYLGCNWVFMANGMFRNCPAYVTTQDCSNFAAWSVDLGFNNGGNGRVFDDQSRSSSEEDIIHLPNGGGLLNIINCSGLPDPDRLEDTGLIQIGRPIATNTVNIVNCIVGGGGITVDTIPGKIGRSAGNVFIGSGNTATNADRIVSNANDIFVDPGSGNFAYKQGSILGVSGVDPTPELQPFIDAFAAVGIDISNIQYSDGTDLDVSNVSVGPLPIDFEYIPPPFTPAQIVGFNAGSYLFAENLTPTIATKKLTLTFQVYNEAPWNSGARYLYLRNSLGQDRIRIIHSSDNRLVINFEDTSGIDVAKWVLPRNLPIHPVDEYLYHLISIDTELGRIQHYINDVEITYNALSIVQDGMISANLTRAYLNASDSGGFGSTQAIRQSDLTLSLTEALDFSIEANRRKFHDENGSPNSLGFNGLLAYESSPFIYLSNDASNFHINRGSGGDFVSSGPDLFNIVSS